MSRKLSLIFIVVLIVAGCGYYFRANIGGWFSKLYSSEQNILSGSGSSLLPPPLRGLLESDRAHLTHNGTLVETNKARAQEGLGPLTENSTLDTVADRKLKDMFAQQ